MIPRTTEGSSVGIFEEDCRGCGKVVRRTEFTAEGKLNTTALRIECRECGASTWATPLGEERTTPRNCPFYRPNAEPLLPPEGVDHGQCV